MRLSLLNLRALLLNNVAELRFKRRIPKKGFHAYRRMLCTNDQRLLNSPAGIIALHYVPTLHGSGLQYDPTAKNLICVWDLFFQNWRMINCNDCDVVSVIQTYPDPKKFWTYFEQQLIKMGASEKLMFMNN